MAGTTVISVIASQRAQWMDLLPAVSQVGWTSMVNSLFQSWPRAALVLVSTWEGSRLQVFFTRPPSVQVAVIVSISQSWPRAGVDTTVL